MWFHDPIASLLSWEAWRFFKSSEVPPNCITNQEYFSLVNISELFRALSVEIR